MSSRIGILASRGMPGIQRLTRRSTFTHPTVTGYLTQARKCCIFNNYDVPCGTYERAWNRFGENLWSVLNRFRIVALKQVGHGGPTRCRRLAFNRSSVIDMGFIGLRRFKCAGAGPEFRPQADEAVR